MTDCITQNTVLVYFMLIDGSGDVHVFFGVEISLSASIPRDEAWTTLT